MSGVADGRGNGRAVVLIGRRCQAVAVVDRDGVKVSAVVGVVRRCDGRGNGRAVVLNWSATVGDGWRCRVLPVSRSGSGRPESVGGCRRCQAVAVRIGTA